jgi:hypothetical protein
MRSPLGSIRRRDSLPSRRRRRSLQRPQPQSCKLRRRLRRPTPLQRQKRTNMGFNLGQFIEREIKYSEAAFLRLVSSQITEHTPQLTAALGQAAGQGIPALVALLEKSDAGLGPVASGAINAGLAMYEPQIEAELEPLIAEGTAFVPALAAAIGAVAAKLQAEGDDLPTRVAAPAVAKPAAEAEAKAVEPVAAPEPASAPEPTAPEPAAAPEAAAENLGAGG